MTASLCCRPHAAHALYVQGWTVDAVCLQHLLQHGGPAQLGARPRALPALKLAAAVHLPLRHRAANRQYAKGAARGRCAGYAAAKVPAQPRDVTYVGARGAVANVQAREVAHERAVGGVDVGAGGRSSGC